MNINPLSNGGLPVNGNNHTANRNIETHFQSGVRSDSLSLDRSAAIENAMSRIPEIRPEVVERGRQLLADPNYPGKEVVSSIASLIVPFDESL